ncbi:uncharacterized protein [Parasteatoda tepidariorum]
MCTSFHRCRKLAPDNFFPSAENLEAVCQDMHKILDCQLEELAKCADKVLDAVSTSDYEAVVAAFSINLGTKSLVDDLCDSTTQYHKAYVRNIGCINDTVMDPMAFTSCTSEANALNGSLKFGEDVDDQEHHCIVNALRYACFFEEVLKKCGEEAWTIIVESEKRGKALKYYICTPQSILNLKTKYLEISDLESKLRIIFEKVFDMKK